MEQQERTQLSYWQKNWVLFKIYFLISLFTFTGGIAMISALKREICDKHRLMADKEFYNYAAISQTLPGVIGVTNASLVGKKINGTSGMFIAAFATILPAFVFMLIATGLYQLLPKEGPIFYALSAIRSISAAFIFSAALTIAKLNLKNIYNIIIAVVCFIAIIFGLLDAIWLIVIAIAVGFLLSFKKKQGERQCQS